MSFLAWIGAGAAVWIALSLPVGVLVGRLLRGRGRQHPEARVPSYTRTQDGKVVETTLTVRGSQLDKQLATASDDDKSPWQLADPDAEPPRDERRGHGSALVTPTSTKEQS